MPHLFLLINQLCLLFGIGTLAVLYLRIKADPSHLNRVNFRFFLADSYLMVIAVIFVYVFINIGNNLFLQKIFASLMISGMTLLQWTLPPMSYAQASKITTPRWTIIWKVSGWITLLQGALLWILPQAWEMIPIIIAFILFSTITALSVAVGFKAKKKSKGTGMLLFSYITLCIMAAGEIWYLSSRDIPDKYYILSLPLAYLLTSWQFFFSKPPRKIHKPVDWWVELFKPCSRDIQDQEYKQGQNRLTNFTQKHGLTQREVEMIGHILEGLSNKEIAGKLSLSENTVRNHIYNLYQKLGIQKRMDLLQLLQDSIGAN